VSGFFRNVDSSSDFSPAGEPPRQRRDKRAAPHRAFTLLEVLLTIAIIALIGTVLIAGASGLLNNQSLSVDDVFWKAVQQARKTALRSEHDIRLKFDKDKKQFAIIDGIAPPKVAADGFTKEEVPLKTFPVLVPTGTDLLVEFLAAGGKGGNLIMIGGVVLESQPIQYVTFYSDGTCMPFRLQMMRNGAAHTLKIDPWTCAQVLTPEDQNAL
jgi:general secretion pathway protein H